MTDVKYPELPAPVARLYRDKCNQKRWDSRACTDQCDTAVYTAHYMRSYADATCALRGAQKESGWRPIETAPKDGSMFLCWVQAERWSHLDGGGSGAAHDVSQIDFCWWRAVPESPNGGYFDAACGQVGDSQDVTHWMPLPSAPTPIPGEAK